MAAFHMVQEDWEPIAVLPQDVEPLRGRAELFMRYTPAASDRRAQYELYSITGEQKLARQIVEVGEVEAEVLPG